MEHEKCQVIFLNRWLDCPLEVLQYHQRLQIVIQEAKAKWEYETRNYSPSDKYISKIRSQELCRRRLKLVSLTEEIEENTLE